MGRRTGKKEDQWFGIVDARKRKQIQDRLAQRARRERLAKSTPNARKSSTQGTATCVTITSTTTIVDHIKPGCPKLPPLQTPLSPDQKLLPLPNHTIFSALFQNGVILGLVCSTSAVSTSRPALPHVPESLRPTQVQLENVHFTWIDRFPLPKLREKMIVYSDVLNSEEFLADICNTTTFTLMPGGESWNKDAWFVDQAFRQKWNCLF